MNRIDLNRDPEMVRIRCRLLMKTKAKRRMKSGIKRKTPDFGWRIKFLMRENVLE